MPLPTPIFPVTWLGYLGLHEIILYIVIVLLIASFGGGPALKALFNAILKAFGKGSSETIVNFNPGGDVAKKIPKECEGCGLIVDPTKCVMHSSEHERSKRNEAQIASLWEEYGKLRNESLTATAKLKDEMNAGFKEVNTSIINSNNAILGALAGDRNGHGKLGRGGND